MPTPDLAAALRDRAAALQQRLLDKDVDAIFFTGAVPVTQIRDIAAAGEVMPPKSTYFFPKVLTGLLFHPLDEE